MKILENTNNSTKPLTYGPDPYDATSGISINLPSQNTFQLGDFQMN